MPPMYFELAASLEALEGNRGGQGHVFFILGRY
jgi:hypothetical protein